MDYQRYKFRAWIVERFGIETSEFKHRPPFMSEPFAFNNFDGDFFLGNACDIDEMTIMQFTGIKDKTGEEIYEGYILKYDGEKCPHCGELIYSDHDLYVIRRDEETCSFVCENENNFITADIWSTEMLIVGNVFENPNLLNKGETNACS